MVVLYILGVLLGLLIQYLIANEFYKAAVAKGWSQKRYLWIPFLLGMVGYLLVIALPDRGKQQERFAASAPRPMSGQGYQAYPAGQGQPYSGAPAGQRPADTGRQTASAPTYATVPPAAGANMQSPVNIPENPGERKSLSYHLSYAMNYGTNAGMRRYLERIESECTPVEQQALRSILQMSDDEIRARYTRT